jgi:FMN-dependent NADH-azoreductase
MPKLLHIDSSPLYGRSVSRELTAAFVAQWKASNPDGEVVHRDLNAPLYRRSMQNGSGPSSPPKGLAQRSRRACFRYPIP